jgi:hypothetical protein
MMKTCHSSKKRAGCGPIFVVATMGCFVGCGGSDGGGHRDAGLNNQNGTPVMNRPVAGTYQCTVTRDRTTHAPRTWTGRSALQPLVDGSIYLSRVEWETPTSGWIGPNERAFLSSRFEVDGSLGDPRSIPVDDANSVLALTSAPRGDGFALLWADEQALHFAAFDANNTLVIQPKAIASPAIDPGIQLSMAADRTGDGFAVALTERHQQNLAPRALFLDRDGNARGPLRALATTGALPYYLPAPYVAAAASGYAFVWNDPVGKSGRILFMKTDTSGTETVPPRAISSIDDAAVSVGLGGFGFERTGPRIVEMNGSFVAAWSEGREGRTAPGGYSPTEGGGAVVRLTRLDSEGHPTASAFMRAHQDDVDEVEPVLTPWGDALAVSWSRGTHIYMCGGCVPDHRIDVVLIDPNSFDPLSQVATITNGGGRTAGGLLRKQAALANSSLLVLYDLTFHTWTVPGSLAVTCTP